MYTLRRKKNNNFVKSLFIDQAIAENLNSIMSFGKSNGKAFWYRISLKQKV